jgi:hypothetical protein
MFHTFAGKILKSSYFLLSENPGCYMWPRTSGPGAPIFIAARSSPADAASIGGQLWHPNGGGLPNVGNLPSAGQQIHAAAPSPTAAWAELPGMGCRQSSQRGRPPSSVDCPSFSPAPAWHLRFPGTGADSEFVYGKGRKGMTCGLHMSLVVKLNLTAMI